MLEDHILSAAPENHFPQANCSIQLHISLLALQRDIVRQMLESTSWAYAGGHAYGQRGADSSGSLALILQFMDDLFYSAGRSVLGTIRTWYACDSDTAPHLAPPTSLASDCRSMATLRRHENECLVFEIEEIEHSL